MPAIQYVRKLSNPRRKSNSRKRKSSTRRKRSNPLRVVTLGAANPRKRRNKVARRKTTRRRRRRTTTAPRRRRRRNYSAPRRRTRRRAARNPSRAVVRRRRRTRRRRNMTGAKDWLPMILGGLVGVTANKTFVSSLPPNLTGTAMARVLSSGVVAFGVGWIGERFITGPTGKVFSQGLLFGGLMQAMSVALNSFLPGVGAQIGLQGRRRGMGDLIGGARYPVPQNPLLGAGSSAPPVSMSGVRRAYGNAY